MKLKFHLINEASPKDLNAIVNIHLEQGWELYGQPFAARDNETKRTRWCQAVYRNLKSETK